MQLPLNIRLADAYCFANFLAGRNEEPVEALQAGVSSLAHGKHQIESIFISGSPASGKTHLLQSACLLARELELEAVYLPLGEAGLDQAGILEGLGQLSVVCIDDVHRVAGQPNWDRALFSLYEAIKDHGLLACASSSVPAETGFKLKDLVSRLQKGLVYKLQNLDHGQKLQVIRQRAHLRGLEITDEVASYIESHLPRDMQSLVRLLEQLDQESLIQQRRITIPFIRSLVADPEADV